MRRPPKNREALRCQAHCSGCGACFSSDSAFDRHRGGSFHEGTRCCWPEDAEDRLLILREDGICEIGHFPPRIGVRLWGVDASWRRNSPSLAPSDAESDRMAA